jgi:hypothetical protein
VGKGRRMSVAHNADSPSPSLSCRLKAEEFERRAKGFKHHVRHEHSMWHYLSFFMHLEEKDATDYNSHEQVSAALNWEWDWCSFQSQVVISLFPSRILVRTRAIRGREDDLLPDQPRALSRRRRRQRGGFAGTARSETRGGEVFGVWSRNGS